VGDRGAINYKRCRRLTADIDRVRTKGAPFEIWDFSPYGYYERQYCSPGFNLHCSPGFNLPVGSFRRTPHGEYPEYHTSADNLEFVSASQLADSFMTLLDVIESSRAIIASSISALWESRNLEEGVWSPRIGGREAKSEQLALLWVLNLADENNSILDIAERSGLSLDQLRGAVEVLIASGLLSESQCRTKRSVPS
jgi:aminopeptidase-like protein